MPSDADHQAAPMDATAVRDRLTNSFALLGIRSRLQVVTYGLHKAVAFSPLWDVDAHKLAEALDKIPELRPYTANRPGGGRGELMGTCAHLGVRVSQRCPRCQEVVGASAPTP
jgi:hypothetical protein